MTMGKRPNKTLTDGMRFQLLEAEDNPERPYLNPPEGMADAFVTLWNQIVSSTPRDYLRDADKPLLKLYVESLLDLERLRQTIDLGGYVVTSPHGSKESPAVSSHAKILALSNRLATSLRLTPSSRKAEMPISRDKMEEQPKTGRRRLRLAGS